MLRRRTEALRETISSWDWIVWLLIGMGTAVVLALTLPQFLPDLRYGNRCTEIGPPEGGNSRSLLAVAGEDDEPQNLTLAVQVLNDDPIALGQNLEIQVIFRNDDIGPVTLYLPESPAYIAPVSTTPGVQVIPTSQGITLEIRNTSTGQFIQSGTPVGVVTGSYDFDRLHLLQAQNRCRVVYGLTPAQLPGLTPGTYSIRAWYYNTNPGAIPAAPTATSLWANQGVWASTSAIFSEPVEIEIVDPAVPTSAPPT